MPVPRIGRNRQKRRGQAPLQILPPFVQGVHVDGDVADEAGPGTVREDGEPPARRRETQGHNSFRWHIIQTGVRLGVLVWRDSFVPKRNRASVGMPSRAKSG